VTGEFASRYFLTVGVHDVELYPLDGQTYSVIIDGEIEGPISGHRTAHANAVKRMNKINGLSEKERSVMSDLSKWSVETVDTFDPEGNE
jgi:hypothetical protein